MKDHNFTINNKSTAWTTGTISTSAKWIDICPNCSREMPNLEFKRGIGCLWCVQKEELK